MSISRPVIGITRDSDGSPKPSDSSFRFYSDSVSRAGGDVRSIFHSPDLSGIDKVLDEVDGLLFTGGNDIDPVLYGQPWHPNAVRLDPQRQQYEFALLAAAEKRAKPILGICLGCQLLNVHRGGSLIQFLPDMARTGALEHRKINDIVLRHDVNLEVDSVLGNAIGKPLINVNTYHKQAVDRVGRGLRVVGRAPDGVIEAIEDDELPLFAGVQWHPERISDEPDSFAVFKLLVSIATASRTT